jgi:hypothetical protein
MGRSGLVSTASQEVWMGRFGEYLVDQGALTVEQLGEALEAQRERGGRLGTVLVELGYVVLEDLATQLSGFHDCPPPPTEWLEAPDPNAMRLVPRAILRRYHLLPLRVERERIHVAMIDPSDEIQRALVADTAARPVVAYVLPEVRLLYWLEMHCGIDRHPRFVNLAARARTSGGEDVEAAGTAEMLPAPLPAGEHVANDVVHTTTLWPSPFADDEEPFEFGREAADDTELLLEELATAPAPQGTLTAPSGPGEVATLEALLQGAEDRDRVIELGLRLALGFARNAVLFVVRGGVVAGHRGAGRSVTSELSGVQVPVQTPSLFARPAVTALRFRGVPPHDGFDGSILEAIGCVDAQEVLLQPISIRGRVVNLLYADNGGDALADTQVAALTALGETMATAYERLILEAKRAR